MLGRTQKLVWCLGYGYHFLNENLSAGGWETTGGSAPKFSLEEDASKSGSSSTFSSVSEIFFCRFHCQVAVTKPHLQKPFLRCYFQIERWHEQKEHRSGKSLESCCTCLPMSTLGLMSLLMSSWCHFGAAAYHSLSFLSTYCLNPQNMESRCVLPVLLLHHMHGTCKCCSCCVDCQSVFNL